MLDLSLYFHFPFCQRKCPYCHFFVVPNQENLKAPFLKALETEWERHLPLIQSQKVVSFYFGGGTPILFPEGVQSILKNREKIFTAPDCEITIEANPEEITLPLIKHYKELGVNRVSIGVQSFDDFLLQCLHRKHSAKKALQSIEIVEKAGISNISIDLMYELPFQKFENWKETVNLASSLPITHLSLYNLTFEPKTRFYREREKLLPFLPSEEEGKEMLLFAIDYFEKRGLKQYEISAFARKEKVSIHNIGYWIGRSFLGFGPSAFSFFAGRRFQNSCHFHQYIKAMDREEKIVEFEESLPYPANVLELLAIGLRVLKGVDLSTLEKHFASLPLTIFPILKDLTEEGFVQKTGNCLALTQKGLLFYDLVAEKIIA